MNWEYEQPVKVIFGNKKREQIFDIASKMSLKRGFLVCDRFLAEKGIAADLMSKSKGMIADVFSDIEPNPTVTSVDTCAAEIRRSKADFVVAMGGGSAMDAAKAAAVIATTEDSITKYHKTGVALPDVGLPIIALPTTSGTGSEVTPVSVLTNEKQGFKAPILGRRLYPVVAIIDPELTYTVPPKVVAQAGLDVLCHAVEGYMSVKHQPICDALAIQAARLVFENIEAAVQKNESAQDNMALASVMAGLAFGQPKTGAPHACSYVLTNRYGIPHGEACALTLDYFVEVAATKEQERLDFFANQVGLEDTFAMTARIRELKESFGLLTNLKKLGLDEKGITLLVKDSQHPNMLNSPVEITEDILYKLYRGLV